jgi:hypothetical protein
MTNVELHPLLFWSIMGGQYLAEDGQKTLPAVEGNLYGY